MHSFPLFQWFQQVTRESQSSHPYKLPAPRGRDANSGQSENDSLFWLGNPTRCGSHGVLRVLSLQCDLWTFREGLYSEDKLRKTHETVSLLNPSAALVLCKSFKEQLLGLISSKHLSTVGYKKKKTCIYQARHHPHLAVCLVCAVSQFSLAFEECLSSFKQSSLALQLESTTALLPVSGFQYR